MPGIVPIKSTLIADIKKFKQILKTINPQRVYLNDGILLKPLHSCTIHVYTNKTLLQILEDIKILPQLTATKSYVIPSFADMLVMDPKMTKQEYNNFRLQQQRPY